MSERTTIELSLPDSGATVFMYETLTIGDSRKIQRTMMSEIKMDITADVEGGDNKGSVTSDKISGAIVMDQQEAVLKLLIHKIVDKDGKTVENIEDFIYNLSLKDGRLVYKKVEDIDAGSTLSVSDKKK